MSPLNINYVYYFDENDFKICEPKNKGKDYIFSNETTPYSFG